MHLFQPAKQAKRNTTGFSRVEFQFQPNPRTTTALRAAAPRVAATGVAPIRLKLKLHVAEAGGVPLVLEARLTIILENNKQRSHV